MTPTEYRELLAVLDLTQARAARLLGIAERTSRFWAAGGRDISPPAERFLRLLVAAKISPDRAMRLLDDRK
jgi:DNA-binding transcriptional regulator YiaG